jgi:nucleoside-diphosphate-sugar epimerase
VKTVREALVTGSAGFVGRHMVMFLEERGWRVWRCDIDFEDNTYLNPAVELFTDGDDHAFDLVVHAAALNPHRAAIDSQPYNLSYNLLLDAALFEWAIRTRQRHVVYLSSSAAYPIAYQRPEFSRLVPLGEHLIDLTDAEEPDSHYGWTKLTGERMAVTARQCGVPVTVVRPFSGYGSDQSSDFPFRAFIERARRREYPFTVWGSATQVRDWIHIDDIIAATYALYEADAQSQYHAVNLCTGDSTAMGDLAQLIIDSVGGGYAPILAVDRDAPLGVHYRVGDPTLLHEFYVPKVSLHEGVLRALREVRTLTLKEGLG